VGVRQLWEGAGGGDAHAGMGHVIVQVGGMWVTSAEAVLLLLLLLLLLLGTGRCGCRCHQHSGGWHAEAEVASCDPCNSLMMIQLPATHAWCWVVWPCQHFHFHFHQHAAYLTKMLVLLPAALQLLLPA
jgi:hypothetical protein